MTWQRVCRDLAALDASLADSLAGDPIRLACLHSYLRCFQKGPFSFSDIARAIRHRAERLKHQPRFREMQRLPLPGGTQHLVWLDGEALCVTRAFREELGGHIPDWLRLPTAPSAPLERRSVPLANQRSGNLVFRTVSGLSPLDLIMVEEHRRRSNRPSPCFAWIAMACQRRSSWHLESARSRAAGTFLCAF